MSNTPVVAAVILGLSLTNASQTRAAADGKPIVTHRNVFSIPFAVEGNSSAAGPAAVQLFVSGDRGDHWTMYQRQHQSVGKFDFRAGQDGEYWFMVGSIDSSGRVYPQGKPEPELRIIVDTVQPQLTLTAQVGSSGEVRTRWVLVDDNMDASSFTLQYRAGADAAWNTVGFQPISRRQDAKTYVGEATWRTKVDGPLIYIRGEVHDLAGNRTSATRHLTVPRETGPAGVDNREVPLAERAEQEAPSTGQHMADSVAWPGQQIDRAPAPQSEKASDWRPASRSPVPLAARPSSPDIRKRSRNVRSRTRESSGPEVSRHLLPEKPNRPRHIASGPPRGDDILTRRTDPFLSERSFGPPSDSSPYRPISSRMVPPDPSRSVTEPYDLGPEQRPRVARSRRVELDYDIDDELSEVTLGRVELWYTTNQGREWLRYGSDEDKQSPFLVEVQQEGTYGFRLVLQSADGLSARPPRAGDPADISVHVDWTRPQAQFRSARYGTGVELGKLLIRWEASDRDLAERPVTLSYSAHPGGPWTSIVAGLANTGQYAWHVDQRVPRQFHLRLEVRDRAGNVGTDQLTDPISVDGLAPKGRIRSVRSLD